MRQPGDSGGYVAWQFGDVAQQHDRGAVRAPQGEHHREVAVRGDHDIAFIGSYSKMASSLPRSSPTSDTWIAP